MRTSRRSSDRGLERRGAPFERLSFRLFSSTILTLRPTESRIVWLQQFGRGLRKTIGDKVLTVVDYIGNHRAFLLKPQTLFNLGPGDHEVFNLRERARQGRSRSRRAAS